MTQEEHRKRILAVAPRLEEIIHMGIEYYNSEPLWRLMIFDEAVYIASYLDKDGERLEGLFSSVTRIPVDTSVYDGFLMHFDRLQ
jgi:hypothetical protein